MAIATTNPATGEILRQFEEISDDQLEACLVRAVVASQEQRLTTFEQRSAWMRQAADLLDAENETVARLMTTEMGKTVKSAAGRGRQVRPRLPLLRRARRGAAGRRAGRRGRCRR